MALKKKSILLIMAFLIGCFVCACGKEDSIVDESLVEDTEDVSSTEEIKSAEEEAAEQWEKGYPVRNSCACRPSYRRFLSEKGRYPH